MTQPSLNRYTRSILKYLRGYASAFPLSSSEIFTNQQDAYFKATTIVRFFYFGLFFFTTNAFMFLWEDWSQLTGLPQPLWPVAWLNNVPFLPAVNIIGISAIVVTLLAAVYPTNRYYRLLSAVTFFLIMAIIHSFGKINHGYHVWIVTGFMLIFLPNKVKDSVSKRHQYLTVILGTQLLTLSFYTSSGIWKIKGFLTQAWAGEIHAFHPLAMSQQIADRLLQTESTSLAGPFFIEHPYLGWPLYSGAILLELFAIVVAFRPNLHRFWGISLLLFHLGTWLTMSIIFHTNMLFVLIFFVLSPFHPTNLTVKDVILSLPILGDSLAYFYNRQAKNQLVSDR